MKVTLTDTSCSIPLTSKAVYIKIKYVGKALIIDKTPENYMLYEKDKCLYIMIFKKGLNDLQNLFDYEGKFNILNFRIFIHGQETQECKVDDLRYAFLTQNIQITAARFFILTEDMKKPQQKRVMKRTRLAKTKINNMYTANRFFIEKTGEPFHGFCHLHLEGKYKLRYMTGGTHTKTSKLLTLKNPKPPRLVYKDAITKNMLKNYTKKVLRS